MLLVHGVVGHITIGRKAPSAHLIKGQPGGGYSNLHGEGQIEGLHC
jgi:hypothetical protein